jgi:hypothetical protein
MAKMFRLCQDEFQGRLLNLEYEVNPPADPAGDLDTDKAGALCEDDIINSTFTKNRSNRFVVGTIGTIVHQFCRYRIIKINVEFTGTGSLQNTIEILEILYLK